MRSLSRGANIIGFSLRVGPEVFVKDVELDSEVIPQVRHMPLSNSAGPGRAPMITNTKIARGRVGVADGIQHIPIIPVAEAER